MKRCSHCKVIKLIDLFSLNRSAKDGRQRECKACSKERRNSTLNRKIEVQRIYQTNNREKFANYAKKWREKNPGYFKTWQSANLDRCLTIGHRYRARKLKAFIEDVSLSVVYDRDKGVCGICHFSVSSKEKSLDHVVPLSKGGEHSYANVQLAHLLCNSRKGAKFTLPIIYV